MLTFLYIARGSAGEVRSMLILCDRLPYFADLKSEISDLKSASHSVAKEAPLAMLIPLCLTAAISVALGLYPDFFMQFASAVLP